MRERRAVIDVGTNSVKLLVAELIPPSTDHEKPQIQPLLEKSEQTRLGRGFYPRHILQASSIERTARAIASFAADANELGATRVRVIGTSATRDATNQSELIAAINQASGLKLEIISGVQEADWVFAGVTTDPRFTIDPIVIVDVGGGSTEFILGQHAKAHFRQSFHIGTVRLCEQLPHSDPPSAGEWERCRTHVDSFLQREVVPLLRPAVSGLSGGHVRLVGTGGTTTILAGMQLQLKTFDRERIESLDLTQDQVRAWEKRLWSSPLSERKNIPGLPPNRADVILFGVSIFSAIMRQFDFPLLYPTTRGLRFAALLA